MCTLGRLCDHSVWNRLLCVWLLHFCLSEHNKWLFFCLNSVLLLCCFIKEEQTLCGHKWHLITVNCCHQSLLCPSQNNSEQAFVFRCDGNGLSPPLSHPRTSVPSQPSYGSCSPTHGKVNKLPSVSQLMNPQQRNTLTPSSMSGGLTDSKCAPFVSLPIRGLRPHPTTSQPVPPGLIVNL